MVAVLKDVAEQVGVSIATVSQVLNARPSNIRISEQTRKKILTTAQKLNYRPNISARGLRMLKTHTVGIISYDANDLLAVGISTKVDQFFWSKGYRTIVGDARNQSMLAHHHMEEFIAAKVDGIILLASSYQPDPADLEYLQARNFPVASIGRDLSGRGVQSFTVNNRVGTRLLGKHLVMLGHRKIAVIVGSQVYEPDSTDRLEGIKEACQEAGFQLDPELVIRETEAGWDPRLGYSSMRQLLEFDRPEAVVAFDDCTAYGAIRAVSEKGLRVPDDIAVVGFDDLPMSAFYNPPLTTVQQPVEQLASGAVEFLLPWMDGQTPDKRECRVISPRLVVRNSSGTEKPRVQLSKEP